MPRDVKASESVAARRRVFFHLVGTDGITPATGEAGGQPQISTNGAAWTDTGIGVLVAIGQGRYYADISAGAVGAAGDLIETRYKSGSTAECPGDTVRVVAFDPYADVLSYPLGAYASGTAGHALGTLSTGRVNVVSPLSLDGQVLRLTRGDDYLAADGRAIDWTDNANLWPTLTGAAVTFGFGAQTVAMSVIVATGAGKKVRLELTNVQTSAEKASEYPFSVHAVVAGHAATLLRAGKLILSDRR